MLTLRNDLNVPSGSTFLCACTNATGIFVGMNDNSFRIYDWNWNQKSSTGNALGGGLTGLALVNQATACGVFGSAQVDFFDVNTGAFTKVTTNATATWSSVVQQQIAGNPSTGKAVATSTTAGKLMCINGSTQTITAPTPAALSGANATCVTNKTDTNTFLIGTSNGKVHEVDSSGTVLKSITLPTTPNDGGAVNHVVSGVSYYNDSLAVALDKGILYIYQYSTSTIVAKQICSLGGVSNNNTVLCDAASGITTLTRPFSVNNYCSTSVLCFSASGSYYQDVFFNETSQPNRYCGIEPSINRLWIGSSSTSYYLARTFDITALSTSQVQTRIQNPPGTDVTGRIIRIRDDGINRSMVELDQTISAGQQLLNAYKNHNYIEIALTGTRFVDEAWDIREFEA